jgi:uncharacterized membrane protein
MSKGRLEAFSDGVIAILITIMVLELKVPHSAEISAMQPLLPVFLSYLLSFLFLGIYWNNHHHLLQASKHVDGRVLWANLHLLFWLSLIPFVTSWMGDNNFATWPVALYGIIQFMAGLAYFILSRALTSVHDGNAVLAAALQRDEKGKMSVIIYAIAISMAFFSPWIACLMYVGVVGMWLIPDRRIEQTIKQQNPPHPKD